jgi:Skp family chaperone for outer membrane proteins
MRSSEENMKKTFVTAVALVFFAIAAVSAMAQPGARPTPTPVPRPTAPPPVRPAAAPNAPVPTTKIALVNTDAFRDEKVGIARYLKAAKSVDAEFQPRNAELSNLQTRIKAIADEITKLSANPVVSPETIRAKQEEAARLQRELKYKKEQADADFEKRYTEAVLPVSRDIGNALIEYANQQGLTMILDISKLEPAILTLNPAADVTLAFIADYNSKHP